MVWTSLKMLEIRAASSGLRSKATICAEADSICSAEFGEEFHQHFVHGAMSVSWFATGAGRARG